MKNIRKLLISEARRVGFALAGFTTPEPPLHLDQYQNWLAHGYHGEMAYMNDTRRADPCLLLPGCRSILVLAMRYPKPDDSPGKETGRGRVAAYARGLDYHLVLQERMQALVGFLEQEVGHAFPYRICTDSAPLLERDLAQRAGLGWIGKNTCLIHPVIGSWFFLAEILLGIELEPDPPFTADRCGNCTRCMDACPTGALLPDRTLDARRCIAYLTIENKGAIPEELRNRMGAWIFGCDLCQMACPWNRKAAPAGDPAFEPRAGSMELEPCAEMTLTPQEFKSKFKDSPILRARRSGYLRNITVLLGNRGNREDVLVLEKALNDEDALVREHAAWALEKIA